MSAPLLILFGLALGVLAAAFFAACEGAYAAFSTPTGGKVVEEGRTESAPARWLKRGERLQHAIAIGHLLAVAWVAALAWLAAASRFGTRPLAGSSVAWWGWLVLLFGVAFVVHAAGELVPRALATAKPRAWVRRSGPFLVVWHVALLPFSMLAMAVSRAAACIVGPPKPLADQRITSRDVRSIVAETSDRADLAAAERQMITSIFDFGDTTAREVMTPRTDLFALPFDLPVDSAVRRVREAERSRVPVYRETLDSIDGVLYAKDLLAIAHGLVAPPSSLASLLKNATFVPEAKKIDDLLREFQRGRIHMAIVVDEYGGTAGIVTVEDILEELVGEIQDEYDQEPPLVVPLEGGALRVDGRLDADDFNDLTAADLEADGGVETVGGIVARELGHVPVDGESVEIGEWTFLVEGVEGKRVTRLRAWRTVSTETGEEK